MTRVPLFSAQARVLADRGPTWREHPAYYRAEPPWCEQCHGHRSECAFCGFEGDGRCDGEPYPADMQALTASAASDAPQPGGGDRRPAADGVAGRRGTPHNDIAADSVREPAA